MTKVAVFTNERGNLEFMSFADFVLTDGEVFIAPKKSDGIPKGFRPATPEEIAAYDVPVNIINEPTNFRELCKRMYKADHAFHFWHRREALRAGLAFEEIGQSLIDVKDVPPDCRDWVFYTYDRGLKIDMKKARKIHMERIRAARNIALSVLDLETMKGRDVQKQKQALRDIPQTFDLSGAKSLEDLKSARFWPKELQDGAESSAGAVQQRRAA